MTALRFTRLGAITLLAFASIAGAQTSNPPVPPGPANLTAFQQLAHSVYKELVEINTVDSVGSTTLAAEAMAKRFRAGGFDAGDVRVIVPDGKPTKGNLVVRYHGRAGGAKPILLLAHLDVVAALRSDWPRDPFVLHEESGWFLGRGTSDDKAMASMFVAGLLQMRKEGIVPDRDLILALTADEEGGGANGVQLLVTPAYKPLIDAAYALNEGGGGTLSGDTPIFHSVQAAEKVPANFTLTFTNPGGHSSVPRPDNAIYSLSGALMKLAQFRFPVALNEITRPFFANTALVEPRADIAAAMRRIVADPTDSAATTTLSADPRYASMLRTTCVATRLSGGHANNALPQTASAVVNCRIVPTSTAAEVRATLLRVIGDTGVRITGGTGGGERFGAAPSAVDPELLSATTQLTRRMWGDIPVIPTMSTGATDGRFLRAAGIPTYGVSGIFSAPGETNAHGRDEKLRIKSYYDGLAFLDALVRQLAVKPKA